MYLMQRMEAIEINSVIEANEWFISAKEEEVMETLTTQPVLSGLVHVIIEEDLKDSEEYSKDMFYSLFGTILKAYKNNLGASFAEVSEEDIDAAFEKQNKFAELLSKSLGFSGDNPDEDEEKKAMIMKEMLVDIETKFNADENFDLKKEGFGELAELIRKASEEIKQPSISAFIQAEIEDADIDEQVAAFQNQQFAIIIDAIETMLERTNGGAAKMKIV
jgi:superfamily II DNA or RNA helicase